MPRSAYLAQADISRTSTHNSAAGSCTSQPELKEAMRADQHRPVFDGWNVCGRRKPVALVSAHGRAAVPLQPLPALCGRRQAGQRPALEPVQTPGAAACTHEKLANDLRQTLCRPQMHCLQGLDVGSHRSWGALLCTLIVQV